MAKFTLEIDCDNAAFCEDGATPSWEISAILEQARRRIQDGYLAYELRDTNGNRVGGYRYDS